VSQSAVAHGLLRLVGVSKSYAVPVLTNIDLDFFAGEIHAIIGANGAGKSTLCRIVAGLVRRSAGHMYLHQDAYSPRHKGQAESVGIQMVQQELNLIPTLTVAENLFLHHLPRRFGCVNFHQLEQLANEALATVGLTGLPSRLPVARLGVGQQQLVEIAKALAHHCRLLILDEPTAALTSREIEHLFAQLRRLRREGVAIVYVSHRLDEIHELADRVTVLRDGRLITTQPIAQLATDAMIEAMTGERENGERSFQSYRDADVVLKVNGMSRGKRVKNISFSLHRGERLGIAGLVGAGRTELLRAMYGADRPEQGTLEVDGGRPRSFGHPCQAVAAGLGLVTEDRKQDGLLLSQSVLINASLNSLCKLSGPGMIVRSSLEQETVRRSCDELAVRCRGLGQMVEQLSGGNQQKVVVARWLIKNVKILLLDEPTRGIDISARRRLYQLFEDLAADGKSLLIVSSDVDELMEICDRILVLSAGQLVAEVSRGDWSREQILAAAFAGYLTPN